MYQLLSGLSMIEASSFVAAPSAGLYCAQMGADVVQVDHIGGGPNFRRWPVTAGRVSLYWENLNRAKSSAALDLASWDGRELLQELIRVIGAAADQLSGPGFLGQAQRRAARDNRTAVPDAVRGRLRVSGIDSDQRTTHGFA